MDYCTQIQHKRGRILIAVLCGVILAVCGSSTLGSTEATGKTLAKIIKVTASSSGSYRGYHAKPENIIGGEFNFDYWCATSTPAWIDLELDRLYELDAIRLGVLQHTIEDIYITGRSSSGGEDIWLGSLAAKAVGGDSRIITAIVPRESGSMKAVRYVRIRLDKSDAPFSHIYKACMSFVDLYEVD